MKSTSWNKTLTKCKTVSTLLSSLLSIFTLASKAGEILDVATQFLSLEQNTIERFDQIQSRLADLESVDQTNLLQLMNDLPDLGQLQADLADINTRTMRIRDDMNQVEKDQCWAFWDFRKLVLR